MRGLAKERGELIRKQAKQYAEECNAQGQNIGLNQAIREVRRAYENTGKPLQRAK